MKQIFILCLFFLSAGVMSAQDAPVKKACASKKSCAKVCTKGKASASVDAETKVASALSAADAVAAEDESIQKKVCDLSGSISYFRKSVCEKSGSVKMTEVQFDEVQNAFVNVSPMDAAAADKDAKVVKASAKEATAVKKKACSKTCSKSKKACAKKEGA